MYITNVCSNLLDGLGCSWDLPGQFWMGFEKVKNKNVGTSKQMAFTR